MLFQCLYFPMNVFILAQVQVIIKKKQGNKICVPHEINLNGLLLFV